jgi:multidrug efflux system membrane fusion protein
MKSTQVVAIALLFLASGCKKPGPEATMKPPPAPVSAAPAEARDVPVYLDEIGRTVAREMVSIQPQISGRVTEVLFVDGADLKAGDAVYTIDARPFQAQLAAAEAAVGQSKATLDLARLDFSRSEKLLEEKAISQQDVDTGRSAVAVAEARLKQGEAAVETARLNLDYCSIRSPIDGRAGQRLVDVGNIVEANKTALLVVQRLDPIYADFSVTERNLRTVQGQMAKGALKVEVRLENDAGPPVEGELTFVDNAVQKESGTVKLRATVANPDRRLWPGQFVKVRLIVDMIKDAVLIPSAALQLSAQGPYVFVVSKESTVEARPVSPGQRQGDKIVVTGSVQPGDQVIVDIRPYVFPGASVTIIPPAAPRWSSVNIPNPSFAGRS